MRRIVFCFIAVLVVPLAGCGLSVDESCKIICETGAKCQPGGPTAESCEALCTEQANKNSDYADAIEAQAECYDKQAGYYDDDNGVCLAIRGGACDVSL